MIIVVLPGTKQNDGRRYPGIKSWEKSVKALRKLFKKICNLKGSLVFYPYRCPDGMKEFSGSSNIHRVWKDYQGVISNTYHGGNIETDHNIIGLIPEDAEKHFAFPNFTTPVPGMMREVLDNDTTLRDNISLNGLGMKKGKSGGA